MIDSLNYIILQQCLLIAFLCLGCGKKGKRKKIKIKKRNEILPESQISLVDSEEARIRKHIGDERTTVRTITAEQATEARKSTVQTEKQPKLSGEAEKVPKRQKKSKAVTMLTAIFHKKDKEDKTAAARTQNDLTQTVEGSSEKKVVNKPSPVKKEGTLAVAAKTGQDQTQDKENSSDEPLSVTGPQTKESMASITALQFTLLITLLLFVVSLILFTALTLTPAATPSRQRTNTAQSQLITRTRIFPQGGGDVELDQPWDLPSTKVITDISFFDRSQQNYLNCCAFVPIPESPPQQRITAVTGYLQNPRYFSPDSDQLIRKEFSFLPAVQEQALGFLRALAARRALERARPIYRKDPNPDDAAFEMETDALLDDIFYIGVHVRRGMDIEMNERNLRHGHRAAPADYYKRAMELAKGDKEKVIFVVCSDNPSWAKKHLPAYDKGMIFHCPGTHREVDMAILIQCNALVLSTGTFSWWTGFLNENASQIIYYDGWPQPGSDLVRMVNKTELFPNNWVPLV
ncbi:hypothetical protein Q1695_010384 [Nippostrongylus brasiliensis]|nr:hypothetical protein Q1695_010384 [Nippostrongylus brasiliensis]